MPFDSFWQAGFESACHVNRSGVRVDLIAATQHDRQARADYARLRAFGIRTVRDGIRWPLVERQGTFDLSSFVPMLDAAEAEGVQVVWSLCHYGWPNDVDVFAPTFPDRFARYCEVVARAVRARSQRVPFYTPINEISFLSWAAGEVGGFIAPHARGRGSELKRQLARAALRGAEALRTIDDRARLVWVDPVIRVIPPRDRRDLRAAAEAYNASQFEVWDMLQGTRDPELGGAPDYLDIMGLNYYHSNQWEYEGGRLRWEDTPRDERWMPLAELLAPVYRRYRRPIFIGETSHFGVGRAPWILELADEVAYAITNGVPLSGVCIYPIVDRPDWENPAHWHNSGLWDLHLGPDGTLERVLSEPYADAVIRAQAVVAAALASRAAAAQVD